MVVVASDGPSHHPTSLRLGFAAHQPSRRHHALSLLDDPRTPHVLEFDSERAAPLSLAATMSHDIRSIGTYSSLVLQFYLAACTPHQVVAFESWTISALNFLHRFTLAESRKPDF